MEKIKWYTDQSAKMAHERMSAELSDFVSRMFPGHELSHSGFNRDDITNEVQIRLHLRPIKGAEFVPQRLGAPAWLRVK